MSKRGRGARRASLASLAAGVGLGILAWKAPPPGPMAEPPDRERLMRGIVVVREAGVDRVEDLPIDVRNAKLPTYSPGWKTTANVTVSRTFGFSTGGDSWLCGQSPRLSPGFYVRKGK